MGVSNRHILTQAPVIGALGRTAFAALRQKPGAGATPVTPGPEFRTEIDPLPTALVKDYIRHVGGDPSAYRGIVPAHLFPQWGFPLATRTLEGLPYPLLKVMNGGCRMRVNSQLPLGKKLQVTARLESIDDDGRRVVLQQHVVTGTKEQPEAVVADFFAIVPLPKKQDQANGQSPKNGQAKKDKPRVPSNAREIGYWKLPANAGLDFAKLTGDFNPIHWIPGYAKASGFRNVILHGFSTMARTAEGLNRGLFAGSIKALHELDVRFTRPLVLPARVGLYVLDNSVFVGDAPGGPAYLVGSFNNEHGEQP
ncbi:MAG: MaoC family dehydratase [Polyangiaceae bacterium]|nr:MaoC family dehydratase [Myxococcales bacterium]MCB9588480.1 MaoC family dehydratase [Polyangiaceae bacterium]